MKYKVLVNKDNKIKENFLNRLNLTEIKNYQNKAILIEEETKNSFLALKEFLKQKNIHIEIESAYSAKDEQEITSSFQTNEHSTALAIDIVIKINDEYIVDKEELLKNGTLFLEIHKYLKDFGFILRYPKNKCHITNHHYAPWHLRYVGNIPAQIIYKNNLTLEEYLTEFSGVLVINKEKNMTSRDVVNIVSKTLGIKKIGHTGTLDPLAEGVLVITIGKATKIGELLTASYKEYEAKVDLGYETDTLDITGNVTKTKDIPKNINIQDVLNQYKKTYFQEVPIYSAVKIDGKKLYEYARNNEEVTLPKKEVTIKEIKLLSESSNKFEFKCLVSKGCYIRSLIRDIGTSLNTCATMATLTRTKQAKFTIEQSFTLKYFLDGKYKIMSIEEALDYPTITVDFTLEKDIRNGKQLDNKYNVTDKIIFKNTYGKALGIYEVTPNNKLKVWKNF